MYVYLTYAVISGIRDINVAQRVCCDALRKVHLCRTGRTSIPRKTHIAIAGDRSNATGAGPLPKAKTEAVRNVEIARAVDRDPFREIHLGIDRHCTVTAVACRSVSGNGIDDAVSGDLPDSSTISIGDVQVSCRIQRHPE